MSQSPLGDYNTHIQRYYSKLAQQQKLSIGSWQGYIARVDNLDDWGPAKDEQSGVQLVITGRPFIAEAAWDQAQSLDYSGGKVARWLLQQWLHDQDNFVSYLNGGFAVVINDPSQSSLLLFTDRIGSLPIYTGVNADQQRVFCTHPDAVADAISNGSADLDKTSIAEMLSMGQISPPYTYYKNVSQLQAASLYRISRDSGTLQSEVYWQPFNDSPPAAKSDEETAEALAQAMRNAAQMLTSKYYGKAGLFLSGGLDSRAILLGTRDPSAVVTMTLSNGKNQEATVAEQIAEATHSQHHWLQRAFDHYGDGTPESVRITGGMGSIKDAHYEGVKDQLKALKYDSLLTGCYADYLYKGLAFNVKNKPFLRKFSQFKELSDYSSQYYQPRYEVASQWQAAIKQRLDQRYPEAIRGTDENARRKLEDARIRPISREVDSLSRLYLWQAEAWNPIMLENGIVEFFQNMSVDQKLNAKVFRKAVYKLSVGQAEHIVDNNDRCRLNTPDLIRKIVFFLNWRWFAIKRRLPKKKSKSTPLSMTGSWINFTRYIASSDVIKELWSNPTELQVSLLSDILGHSPWDVPLDQWHTKSVDVFYRLLAIKVWMDIRSEYIELKN